VDLGPVANATQRQNR